MRSKVSSLLITTSLGVILASSIATTSHAGENVAKWNPQIELEGKAGTSGRKLAYPKMMTPLWQDENSLLFSDVRYKLDNQDSQEFNLGLGYRTKLDSDWAIGGYAFFDRMRSDSEHMYTQGTIGIEALSSDNDIRMNVYIPETTTHAAPGAATLILSGGQALVQGGFERALSGADFEIGQKIPVNFADVRAYAGGYSFSADDFDSVTGPRARLELKLNDEYIPEIPLGAQLTFGAEYQRDDVRGEEAFGLVKLSVPLWGSENKSKLTPLEKRMGNFIQRDVDIVASNGGSEAAEINGVGIDHFTLITHDDIFSDKVNEAGENTLIYVDGSNGEIMSANGSNTAYMESGQILTGGGATVSVRGLSSGITFNHTFAGSNAVINATGNSAPVLYLPNDVEVSDITINNATGSAIFGGADNMTLTNIVINNSAGYGVNFDTGITDLTVNNMVINTTGDDGFNIDGGSDITINGLEVYNSGDEGIELNSVSDVNLYDAVANDSNEYGVSFANASGIVIDGAEVDGAGGDGIIFWGTNSQISISNADVTNTTGNGIEVASVTNLYIDESTTSDTGDSGIHISGTTNATFITDVDISDSGSYGIDFNGFNSNVLIENVTIDTVVNDGFNIDDGDIFQIRGLTVTDAGNEGIELNSVNGITIETASSIGSGDNGILIGNSDEVTASNLTSTGSGGSGLYMQNIDVAELSDNIISDSTAHGIVAIDIGDFTLSDSAISDSGDDGIIVQDLAGPGTSFMTLSGTTITNSGDDGLDLDGSPTSASVNNVTVNTATGTGFEFDNVVGVLSGSGNTISGAGTNCTSAGSTISGTVTYNTVSNCP